MQRATRRKNAARAILLLAASLLATRARNYLRRAEHPSVARALTPEPKQTIRVFYNVYAPLNNRSASKHAVAIVEADLEGALPAPHEPEKVRRRPSTGRADSGSLPAALGGLVAVRYLS